MRIISENPFCRNLIDMLGQHLQIGLLHEIIILIALCYLKFTVPLIIVSCCLLYMIEGMFPPYPYKQVPVFINIKIAVKSAGANQNFSLEQQTHKRNIIFENQIVVVKILRKHKLF